MLSGETTLAEIACVEACIRDDPAALRVLLDGTDPADLAELVLFLAGGLARELHDHHGPEAAQLLDGARRLILEGWQPPPEQ